MQSVSFDGSMLGSVSSAGTVGTTATAGSPENAADSGTESNFRAAQQLPEKGNGGNPYREPQQTDVAAWLTAMCQEDYGGFGAT